MISVHSKSQIALKANKSLMQLRVCIRKILWGTFNQLPREQIENSRDFPREQIHHTTPEAFQQIVPEPGALLSPESQTMAGTLAI